MSVKMRKVGNPHGFIIPAAMLKEARFDPADDYDLTPVDNGILITRVDRDYADAMTAYEDVVAGYRGHPAGPGPLTAAGYRWLTAPVVRVLHARHINDFGGVHGEGGPGDVDALLARPQNLSLSEDADAFELAAGYADALARGRAFTDGNKRIAFTAALVFLALNGVEVPHLGQARATERTLALAAGAIGRAEYAQWLRGQG